MVSAGFGWSALALIITVAVVGVLMDRYHFQISDLMRRSCKYDLEDRLNRWKDLQKSVHEDVFGQHIAVKGALDAIYAHITNKNPRKALVLAFHGNVGSGKTLMSQLIAENLFDGGFNSPYVHAFIGPRHFVNDERKLRENQERLRKEVEEAAKLCGHSLFIFDEVDKMPRKILDVIIPYIDFHHSVDGTDYRGMIFIFLSNTGSRAIRDKTYEVISNGKPRESISLLDFRGLLASNAFQEEGGLFNANMIEKRLVDHYIPFLPLEKKHVAQCARRDIVRRKVLYVQPQEIAEKVAYDYQNFAEDGCKSVATLVDFSIRESDGLSS